MAKYIYDFEQNSAAWLQARVGIPTASNFHRIITPTGKPSKASTTQDYMNRLLYEWITGVPFKPGDEYQSEYMQMGHDEEESAARAFSAQTDLEISTVGFVTTDNGLIGASPDRLVEDWATLEIKSSAGPTHVGRLLGTADLAKEHGEQAQGQLWVCEREKACIMGFHPKLAPIIVQIDRDEEYIDKLSSAVGDFVSRMLEARQKLERQFGPFRRPDIPITKPADKLAWLDITEEDLQGLLDS